MTNNVASLINNAPLFIKNDALLIRYVFSVITEACGCALNIFRPGGHNMSKNGSDVFKYKSNLINSISDKRVPAYFLRFFSSRVLSPVTPGERCSIPAKSIMLSGDTSTWFWSTSFTSRPQPFFSKLFTKFILMMLHS